jgi:hypothetical protein
MVKLMSDLSAEGDGKNVPIYCPDPHEDEALAASVLSPLQYRLEEKPNPLNYKLDVVGRKRPADPARQIIIQKLEAMKKKAIELDRIRRRGLFGARRSLRELSVQRTGKFIASKMKKVAQTCLQHSRM